MKINKIYQTISLVSLILIITTVFSFASNKSAEKDNLRPIAVHDMITVSKNVKSKLDILSNDHDPNNDQLKLSIITKPEHGIANIVDSEFIEYNPRKGFIGQDVITYQISDGTFTAQAKVVIDVSNEYTVLLPPYTQTLEDAQYGYEKGFTYFINQHETFQAQKDDCTYFVNEGGVLKDATYGSKIYLKKGATLYAGGSKNQKIYYESGAKIINTGSRTDLILCEVLTFDYSQVSAKSNFKITNIDIFPRSLDFSKNIAITFTNISDKDQQLNVYNSQGQVVFSERIPYDEKQFATNINFEKFKNDIYYINVVSHNSSWTYKIINKKLIDRNIFFAKQR